MTPKAADTCCAPEAGQSQEHAPTPSDKANCAVCFWAAGILPECAVVMDARPLCTALIEARNALDQYSERFISNTALPRGPPTVIG